MSQHHACATKRQTYSNRISETGSAAVCHFDARRIYHLLVWLPTSLSLFLPEVYAMELVYAQHYTILYPSIKPHYPAHTYTHTHTHTHTPHTHTHTHAHTTHVKTTHVYVHFINYNFINQSTSITPSTTQTQPLALAMRLSLALFSSPRPMFQRYAWPLLCPAEGRLHTGGSEANGSDDPLGGPSVGYGKSFLHGHLMGKHVHKEGIAV